MEIISLGPGFAVELRGMKVAEVASDASVYSAVRAAFEQHSVLVFRNQEVDDDTQLTFSRCFGRPEVTKVGSQGTGTHFVILSTIGEDGKVVPADHRLALRNRTNQLWHTDSSFKKIPALTSVLLARIIPARGGEFVSTRLAFERLEPRLRAKLENSFAWHDYAHSRGQIAPDLASPEERAALPPQCGRLVWKNPVNDRGALYLASHAYAIEGMELTTGKKLLDELMKAATGDELCTQLAQWRHRYVGQQSNHASWPTVAGPRSASHGTYDDFRHCGGWSGNHAPLNTTSGGMTAASLPSRASNAWASFNGI